MANKLKDLFSEQVFSMGGKLSFKDEESRRKWADAMRIAMDEGKNISVEGIGVANTMLVDGEYEYPMLIGLKMDQVTIGPVIEEKSVEVETSNGVKIVTLKIFQTTKEYVMETSKDNSFYIKFVNEKGSDDVRFIYNFQPEKARGVSTILEELDTTIAFLNKFFVSKDDKQVEEIFTRIYNIRAFFIKIKEIEKALGLEFDTSKMRNYDKTIVDVEEVHLLLVKKEIIRLNAKLISNESTCISFDCDAKMPAVGKKIDITFAGERQINLFGQEITVYTANLLTNAVICDIINEDGKKRVLYGDTDDKPMYISYSGFLSDREAKEEVKHIMSRKEQYTGAVTVEQKIMGNQRQVTP